MDRLRDLGFIAHHGIQPEQQQKLATSKKRQAQSICDLSVF